VGRRKLIIGIARSKTGIATRMSQSGIDMVRTNNPRMDLMACQIVGHRPNKYDTRAMIPVEITVLQTGSFQRFFNLSLSKNPMANGQA
jgi:hypothetical protein